MIENNPRLRSHLYLISLADFREAATAKWARLADKVSVLTRAIIQRHIEKNGLFAQVDDETFVIALPAMSRQHAHERVTLIAKDLSSRLLGDRLVAGQRPLAIAANMPLTSAMAGDGGLNPLAIRLAVNEVRSVLVPLAPSASSPGPADADLLARLLTGGRKDRLASGAARRRRSPRFDGRGGTPGRSRFIAEIRAGGPINGPSCMAGFALRRGEWQIFSASRSGRDGLPKGADIRPVPPEAQLSVLWRPTWVAASEGISAYCARILRVDEVGAAPLDGTAAYGAGTATGNLALDRCVVAAAMTALQAPNAALRGAGLILPLCWSSLDSAARWSLTGPLTDLPAPLRRDRLKIELFQVPPGVNEAEIGERLSFIKGLGCDAMIRLRPSSAPVGRMAKGQAKMIGLDLTELGPDEQMGDEDLLANLQRFHQMAASRRIACYLWGVRRRRVLGGSIVIGYEMVNGPGLMTDIGHPAAVVPVSRQNLTAVA